MQIASKTGAVAYKNLICEVPFMQLGITVTHATALSDAQKLAFKIRVNLNTMSGGTIPVMEETTLLHLLELATTGEGGYLSNATTLSGTFPISKDGHFPLKQNEFISIDIEGCETDQTIVLEGIDVHPPDPSYIKYEHLKVNTGQAKEFDITEAYRIGFDATKTKSVQLTYPANSNGAARTVEYSLSELKKLAYQLNDVVRHDGSVPTKVAFDKLIVLPLAGATKLRYTPVDETLTTCYAMTEKLI